MKRLERTACVGLCCVVVGVAVYGILIKDRTTGGVASNTTDSVSGKASSKPGPSGSLESGPQKVQHSQSMPDLHENELGTTQGEPFATGFLFFDGQYVDVPYRVTRKGLGVFVNDKMVVPPPVQWPIREPPSGEADPELPRQLTRNTSFYDEVFHDYLRKKIAYVQNKHGRKEEREIMEKVIRSLPFIKEASLDPKIPDILQIKTYEGDETYNILLVSPRRRSADAKAVLKSVKDERGRLEQYLRAGGCCYFFSEGGRIQMGRDKARERLPRIVAILRSAQPTEVKFTELQKVGMPFVNAESFSALVKGFSPSRQLDERLREMAEGKQATSGP